MPQILKKRGKFTLRLLLDMGNTSLEENLRLKTLDYLLFIPAIFLCLLLGHSMANFWLLVRKQSYSPDDHCIWAINFCSKGDLEGLAL